MASNFDLAVLVGSLARDPETSVTPNGMEFTTAAFETVRAGGDSSAVTYYRLVVFNERLAEKLKSYSKGQRLLVTGVLKAVPYKSKAPSDDDDSTAYKGYLEITVSEIIDPASEDFSKLLIIGNLGAAPELKRPGNGERAVANGTVYVNHRRGEEKSVTQVRVAAWEKLADILMYLKCGSLALYVSNRFWATGYFSEKNNHP